MMIRNFFAFTLLILTFSAAALLQPAPLAAVDVGYYDMVLGQGSADQVAPITAGTIDQTTLDNGSFSSHGYVLDDAALPADAVGASVIDGFPAELTAVSWTCAATGTATCTANGSDNINDTVNVPAGDAVVYTAVGTISSDATGTLTNTASATVAQDPFPDNDSATDGDTFTPIADLSLTKLIPRRAK